MPRPDLVLMLAALLLVPQEVGAQCSAGTWGSGSCTACSAGTYNTGVGMTSVAACTSCSNFYMPSAYVLNAITSTQCQGSTQVQYSFSSIITALTTYSYPGFSGSLDGKSLYFQTIFTNNAFAAGGFYTLTTNNAKTFYPNVNPDFEQWANVTCTSSCVCTQIANGKLGTIGPSTGLSGSGCSTQYWYINNGWSTSGSYTQNLLVAIMSQVYCPAGSPTTTTLCSAGSYCTSISSQTACSIGTYSAAGASSCLLCSAGTYASASGLPVCAACAAGTYQTGTGFTLASDCSACGAGKYGTGTGFTGSASCLACGVGTYQAVTGVSSVAGCSACSAGTYGTGTGLTVASDCTACGVGKYGTGTGLTLSSACLTCGAGGYGIGTGMSACSLCGVGTYQSGTGFTSASVCSACGTGSYQTGTGMSACSVCGTGTYQTGTGMSDVPVTLTGDMYSYPLGSPDYTFAGPYVWGWAVWDVAQLQLDLKLPVVITKVVISAWDQEVLSYSRVELSNTGQFQGEQTAYGTCNGGCVVSTQTLSIPAVVARYVRWTLGHNPYGYVPMTGIAVTSIPCSSCPVGTYMTGSGASACSGCSAGRYGTVDGLTTASSCSACVAGTFSSGVGMTSVAACTQCSAGTFSVASASVCAACPAGSTSSASATACTSNAGYYNLGQSLMAYYSFDPVSMTADSAPSPLGSLTVAGISPTTQTAGPWSGGTCCNAALFTNTGSSTDFTTGQSYAIPAFAFSSTSFSICVWYNPVSDAVSRQYQKVFMLSTSSPNANYISLSRNSNTNSIFGDGGGAANFGASNAFIAGVWTHVCIVVSGAPWSVYVNNLVTSGTSSTSIALVTRTQNYIARSVSGDSGASLFAGALDEFRVYGRALTPAEVASIYGYSSTQTTSVLPVACPTGSFSSSGASICGLCVAGTYGSVTGLSACTGCGAGTYGTGTGFTGSVSCLACGAGTYQSGSGLSSVSGCSACGAGTFSVASSSGCASCPAGSTSGSSATACTSNAGFYDLGQSLKAYYTFDAGNMLADKAPSPLGSLTVSGKSPTLQDTGPWAGSSAALFTQTGSTGYSGDTTNGQAFAIPSFTPTITSFSICLWFSITGFNYQWSSIYVLQGGSGGTLNQFALSEAQTAISPLGPTLWANGNSFNPLGNTIPVTSNTWTHFCQVVNSNTAYLYLNGAVSQTITLSNVGVGTTVALNTNYLGRSTTTNNGLYIGAIDEFRMYPRALTPAEVAVIYGYSSTQTTSVLPVACPTGSYSGSGASVCTLCVAGTYGSVAGLSVCASCGAGTYQTGTGFTGASACLACSAGTYSSGTGLSLSSVCSSCTAGTYQTGTGATAQAACSQCGAGTYSGAAGTSCLACGTNANSNAGSSTCSCNSGYVMPAMFFPFETDMGNYGAVAGATSTYTATNPVTMVKNICDITTNANCRNTVYFNNPSSTNSLGSYLLAPTPNTPQPITISAWVDTAATYYGDLFSLLQSASGSTSSSNSAINFDVGRASGPLNMLYPALRLPNAWTQPPYAGTSFTASRWFHMAITVDSLFNIVVYLNGASAATATGPGPTGFPAGYYAYLLIGGSAESVRGYHGYIKDLRMYQFALSLAQVQSIYNSASTTMSSLCLASPCLAGTYWVSSTGTCTACTVGCFCPVSSTVPSPCGAGTYASVTGLSACTGCGAGTYATGTGFTLAGACLACGAGMYQTGTGFSACTTCGAGTYQTGTGFSACSGCGAATYGTGTGFTLAGSCLPCAAGTYQTGTGTSSCSGCTAGQSSPAGASMCVYYAGATTLNGIATVKYTYSGAYQQWVVPAGVSSLDVKMWGAGGGGQVYGFGYSQQSGGSGGYTSGTITVTPSNILAIVVGGGGIGLTSAGTACGQSANCGTGGWPAGGAAYSAPGGGGRSQVSVFPSGTTIQSSSITVTGNILLIAGGGGGGTFNGGGLPGGSTGSSTQAQAAGHGGGGVTGGESNPASYGGGQTALPGCTAASPCTYGLVYGTLLQGASSGSPGQGNQYGGGGGDGYYGGSCGQAHWGSPAGVLFAAGGAGGSSYINPSVSNGFTYVGGEGTSSASNPPYNAADNVNNNLYGKGGPASQDGSYTCSTGQCTGQNGLVYWAYGVVCPAGTYFVSGSTSCSNCAVGMYTSLAGLTVCVNCGAGTYASVTGLSACTGCAAGTYGTGTGITVSSSCLACGVGLYQSGTGLTAPSGCSSCVAGTYASVTGLSVCTGCGAGTYGTGTGFTLAGACLACSAGTYQSVTGMTSLAACTQCSAGTFSVSGSSACAACPAGSTSGSGVSACTSNAGYYDLGPSLMAYYTFDAGSMLADKAPSPLGSLTASTTAPTVQAAGPWSGGTCCSAALFTQTGSTGQSSDTAKGQYYTIPSLPQFTTSAFSTCLWYYITGVTAQSYARVWGFSTSDGHNDLPLMFYTTTTLTVSSYCNSASVGMLPQYTFSQNTWTHFCFVTSGTTVTSYVNGQFSSTASLTGAALSTSQQYNTNYIARGVGGAGNGLFLGAIDEVRLYSRALTQAEVTAIYGYSSTQTTNVLPVACPSGLYSVAGSSACTACSPGAYFSTGSCAACGAGTYQTGSGMTASSACLACGAGTYQTGTGITLVGSCLACDAGKYSTGLGMTISSVCASCGAGTYQSGAGLSACSSCGAGTYETGTGITLLSGCLTCGAGTYSSGTGMTSLATCLLCGAGMYQTGTGLTLSSSCSACSAGTYETGTGIALLSACLACGAGTYSSGTGMTSLATCLSCGAGTYQTGTGLTLSSSCSACSAGRYGTGTGFTVSSSCLACGAGTYQTGTGLTLASSCLTCGAGTYSSGTGMTLASTCSACGAGMYQTGTGLTTASACLTCGAGTYSSGTGMTSLATCLLCGAGTYQTGTGLTAVSACSTCGTGTYSSGTGMTLVSTCSACVAGLYSSGVGMTISSACASCSAGTFSLAASSACAACPAGSGSGSSATVCTSNAGYYNLGQSLMAYYAFDAGSMLADSSPSPLGQLTASTTAPTVQSAGPWSGGTCCSAALFTQTGSTGVSSDTTNGRSFRLPSATIQASSVSICVWFMPSSLGGSWDMVLDFGISATSSNILIARNGALSQIVTGFYNGSTASLKAKGSTFNINTWYHACSVLSGTTGTLYVGGVSVESGTLSPAMTFPITWTSSYIARSNWGGDSLFTGTVDEVRLYPRALTQAEVTAIYTYNSTQTTSVLPVACPTGSYSGSGASVCALCAAGTYASTTGLSACAACGTGTYSSGIGMSSQAICASCGAGTFSGASSSTCEACPSGSSSASGASACAANAGYYDLGLSLLAYYTFDSANFLGDSAPVQLGALTALTTPPTPTTGRWTGSSAANLTQGYFVLPNILLVSPSFSVCMWILPTRVISNWEGIFEIAQANGQNTVVVLAQNSGSPQLEAATSQSGTIYTYQYYLYTWLHFCFVVSSASQLTTLYSNSGTQSAVSQALSSDIATGITRNANYIGQRYSKPPWYGGSIDEVRLYPRALTQAEVTAIYTYRGNMTTSVMPMICPVGAYSSASSSSACSLCGPGMYGTGSGSSSCSLCGAGTYQTGTGFSSLAGCSLCGTGTYQTGSGLSSSGSCGQCGTGTYSTGTGMTLQSACASCGAGTFSGARSSTCEACPSGSSSASGASTCTSNPGYYDLGLNLLAYYTFDAASMTADSAPVPLGSLSEIGGVSPGATVGLWQGSSAATFAQVNATGTADFTNSQSYRMPNIPASDGMSMCVWFRPATISMASDTILELTTGCLKNPIGLYHGSAASTTLTATIRDGGGGWLATPSLGAVFVAQQWTHACFVLYGTTFIVYINGIASSYGMAASFPVVTRTLPYIARSTCGSLGLFQGDIDEVRIYPRGLVQAEVTTIYTYRGNMTTSVMPVLCPVGTYSSASSSSACSLCGAGTYQTGSGFSSSAGCSFCGTGTYQTGSGIPSSAGCSLCGTGTYQTGSGIPSSAGCSLCGVGTYQTGTGFSSSAGCSLCGTGTYQTGSGIPSSAGCSLCGTGTYQTGSGIPSSAGCSPCGAGTYQTGTGFSSSAGCGLCGTGTYQTGSGIPSSAGCSLCGPGLYQTGSGMPSLASCTLCGTGTYQTGSGLSSSGSCSLCGTGTYQSGTGMTLQSACASCGAGTFSGASSSACAACPTGSASGAGASACASVPGYYDLGLSLLAYYTFDAASMTADSAPVPLGSLTGTPAVTTGAWSGSSAASFSASPSTMPSLVWPTSGAFSACAWYMPRSTILNYGPPIRLGNMNGRSSLIICSAGTNPNLYVKWNDGTGGGNSVQYANFFTPDVWTHICAITYSQSSATVYLNGVNRGSSIMGTMATGTISGNTVGGFNGNLDEASLYPRALTQDEVTAIYTYRGNMTTSVMPMICPVGSFSPASSSSACSQCGAGTYGTGSGSSSCSLCGPGTYQTGTGFSSLAGCSLCGTGTYQTGSGLSSPGSCGPCGTGTYQTGSGYSGCSLCGAGTYQTGSGFSSLASCSLCGTGTYQTGSGLSSIASCGQCGAGTYSSGMGMTLASACASCSNGTFSGARSSTCEACPSGSSSGSGASSCASNPGYYDLGKSLMAYYAFDSANFLGDSAPVPLGALTASATPPTVTTGMWAGSSAASFPQTASTGFVTDTTNGQYFQLPAMTLSTPGFTICLWYKPTGTVGTRNWDQVASLADGHIFIMQFYAGSNSVQLRWMAQGGAFSYVAYGSYGSMYVSNQWVHICNVGTTSSYTVYFNGVAYDNPVQSSASIGTTGTSYLGRCNSWCPAANSATTLFQGVMDEVRLYPRVLTQAEVTAIYTYRGNMTTSVMPVLCQAGTYSSASSSSACSLCGAGTYGTGLGFSSVASCSLCGPGTYQTGTGFSSVASCSLCGTGTYQTGSGLTSVSDCSPCGTGTYGTGSGFPVSAQCSQCGTGTYQTGLGFSSTASCSLCWAGTYQNSTGQGPMSSCKTCDGGFYDVALGASACLTCVANSWCSAGMNYSCPLHSNSPAQASTQNQCLCNAGYFGDGSKPGTSPCALCWSGYYCAGGNGNHSLVCPSHSTSPPESSVITQCMCEPGYYGANGTNCSLCPPDDYCASGVLNPCPGNSSAPNGSSSFSACTCNAGFYGVPPACSPCPPNFYCTGGTNISQCTANAVTAGWLTISSGLCFCDRGYKGTNNTACVACQAGTWCWTGLLNQCPSNTNSSALSSYLANCTCNPGYTGSDGTACSPCDPGKVKAIQGSASCSSCTPGRYAMLAAMTECVACQAGSYQTGVSNTICSLCVAGRYQTGLGMPLQTDCLACGTGLYQTGLGMPLQADCQACGTGLYQTGTGMPSPSNCIMCGAGLYQTGTGMPSPGNCSLCGAGLYQTGSGMPSPSDCIVCNPGLYQTGSGMPSPSNCATCDAGSYCSSGFEYACPAHTTSEPGVALQTQCQCLSGFSCNSVKKVSVRATLSLSLAEFYAVEAALVQEVARALGVDPSLVSASVV